MAFGLSVGGAGQGCASGSGGLSDGSPLELLLWRGAAFACHGNLWREL